MDDEPPELGAFALGPVLASLREWGGLSGGAFGQIHHATGPGGSAVAKLCRPSGGSRTATVAPGRHHPDIGFVVAPLRHRTFEVGEVADVLLAETRILRSAEGLLLPRLLGVYDDPRGLPAAVMEELRGDRPSSPQHLVAVLDGLAELAARGRLAFHGDLKPEHVFVDPTTGSVRLLDPAPRFPAEGAGAFTPEYNPLGLVGPVADVFAVGVMLYELVAGVNPFGDARDRSTPAPTIDARPSATRGRRHLDPAVGALVDEILDPAGVPSWAQSHHAAASRLRQALAA